MASTLVMPSKESGVTAVAEETLQFNDDDLRGEEKYSFFVIYCITTIEKKLQSIIFKHILVGVVSELSFV